MCRRADEQFKGLEIRESECQTDNEESKKLTPELSSINDKITHTDGVAQNQQEFVDKESMALDDATEEACKILVRLDIHQAKLEEEKLAFDALHEESESSEAVHAFTTPPEDVAWDQTR